MLSVRWEPCTLLEGAAPWESRCLLQFSSLEFGKDFKEIRFRLREQHCTCSLKYFLTVRVQYSNNLGPNPIPTEANGCLSVNFFLIEQAHKEKTSVFLRAC